MSRRSINRIGTLILTFMLIFAMSINVVATENVINERLCVLSFVDKCNQPCENQLTQIMQVDTHQHYYNQLNEMERLIYDKFMLYKDKFINNETFSFEIATYESENDENKLSLEEYITSIMKAKSAFTYDNPEAVIWFQNVQLVLACHTPLQYMLTCKPKQNKTNYSDFSSNKEILPAMESFKKCVTDFVSTLEGTDTQKLYKIYNWIIENSEYDHEVTLANNTQNAYGAIVNKKAVCSGFSFAFKYVADLAGLKVLYVTGWNIGNSKEETPVYHAWNMVYVDKEWYLVDVTGGVTNKEKKDKFFMVRDYNSLYKFDKNFFTYSDF